MIHPVVDIQRWLRQFPLGRHLATADERFYADRREMAAAEGRALGEHESGSAPDYYLHAPSHISSPSDLALTEQMRRQAGELPWSEGEPVDVLLPALGEPPRREVSKISGVPYRPRGPWPTDVGGDPLSFIGQLCFTDSQDLLQRRGIQDLPGDVLLIFQETDGLIGSELDGGAPVHFEWARAGMRDGDLISPIDVPKQAVSFGATYFERYRSVDFHEIPDIAKDIDGLGQFVTRYAASKIGGLPEWIQDEEHGLGLFLGCLHSMIPRSREWPLPNVPVAPWGRRIGTMNFLMLGDCGTLYLFWDGKRVRWTMQCS